MSNVKLKDKFVKKYKPKRFGRAKRYILASFALAILLFVSFLYPQLSTNTYAYEATELSAEQKLGSKVKVSLVSYEYNSDASLMRCNFILSGGSMNTKLSNTEYRIYAKYAGNEDLLETSVYRVNDNYMVAYISGLPEGFDLMAINIRGSIIYSELETSDFLNGAEITLYVYEDDVPANTSLEVLSEGDLMIDYIDYQQEELQSEIEEYQETIDTKLLAIAQTKELMEVLEEEILYQTNDEVIDSQAQLSTYEASITKYKKDIEDAQNSITQLEEKILLLEEKKDIT